MFIFILEIRYTLQGSLVMEQKRCPFVASNCVIFCCVKLFYFFLLGRLLSRSNTEKPDAIDENGKEENIMKNMFSKKRKIEVTDCEVEVIPLELETYPRSAVTEECPPKLHNNPKEPVL